MLGDGVTWWYLSLQVYLMHRYDEWVKADRIIWPTEKATKRKQKKKVKVRCHVRN